MDPLQSTLLDYLSQVPDFRCARGQRFAWSYLLALVAAAVAAGQKHVVAMVDWAQAHRQELLTALGPQRSRLPSPATWRRVLLHIDMAALERQIAAYTAQLDQLDVTQGGIALGDGTVVRGQAVDGKDVCGASAHGQYTFLVSLVRHECAYVLAQAAVARKTNEITAVPALLAGRDLTGTVTTMDALLTQRHIAQQILNQGGHYLMILKQNQPTLYAAARLVFEEPPLPRRPGERLTGRHQRQSPWPVGASELGHDHGFERISNLARQRPRSCAARAAASMSALACVETEITYGITSLPTALAGPAQLERIWRGHWTIENRLHYVRDETFGEDRCQVHTGTAAQALVASRNAVVSTLRFHGWSNLAAATRCYAAHPQRAVQLLGAIAL